MTRTLREFMNQYIGNRAVLKFADIEIDVDYHMDGSFAVLKAFMDYKFYFVSFDNGILTLSYS